MDQSPSSNDIPMNQAGNEEQGRVTLDAAYYERETTVVLPASALFSLSLEDTAVSPSTQDLTSPPDQEPYTAKFGLPQKAILINILEEHALVWPENKTNPPDTVLEEEWKAITEEFNSKCFEEDSSRHLTVPQIKIETQDFRSFIDNWLPCALLVIARGEDGEGPGLFGDEMQKLLLEEVRPHFAIYRYGYTEEKAEDAWKIVWRSFNQKWFKQEEETPQWISLDMMLKPVHEAIFHVLLVQQLTKMFGESDFGSDEEESEDEGYEDEQEDDVVSIDETNA